LWRRLVNFSRRPPLYRCQDFSVSSACPTRRLTASGRDGFGLCCRLIHTPSRASSDGAKRILTCVALICDRPRVSRGRVRAR
jgi:hypothetical protein